MEIRVIDCDAIVGFVDYGIIDSEKNGGWSTKMRCRKCGVENAVQHGLLKIMQVELIVVLNAEQQVKNMLSQ